MWSLLNVCFDNDNPVQRNGKPCFPGVIGCATVNERFYSQEGDRSRKSESRIQRQQPSRPEFLAGHGPESNTCQLRVRKIITVNVFIETDLYHANGASELPAQVASAMLRELLTFTWMGWKELMA